MDLLTPARTWAFRDQPNSADDGADRASARMPAAQSVTMFLSVVGPIAGGIVGALAAKWLFKL
jgi:glycerol uptake facilitator-like aquaporin